MQIKSAPSACYAVVADIDADGTVVSPSSFTFTGNLDGRGHLISNLTLDGMALIPSVTGDASEEGLPTKGIVKDLKLYNASLTATNDNQGLLVGRLASGDKRPHLQLNRRRHRGCGRHRRNRRFIQLNQRMLV